MVIRAIPIAPSPPPAPARAIPAAHSPPRPNDRSNGRVRPVSKTAKAAPTSTPPAGASSAAPPESPGAVKRGAAGTGKGPREILLEKKLSVLEDKVDSLSGWQTEVNDLLATMGAGSAKPAKAQGGSAPPAGKGFLDELGDVLGLGE